MKKVLKNPILTFILGSLIFGCIGIVSAFSLFAQDVGFTPHDTSWKKDDGSDITNVKEAIDELYINNTGYANQEVKRILQITDSKVDISDVLTTDFMNKISTNKASAKLMLDSSTFRSKVSVALLNALNVTLVSPLPTNNTNMISSSNYSNDWTAWKAFIESDKSWCTINGAVNNSYIGYNFNKKVNVRIIKFINGGPQAYQAKTVKLQCSNDNSNWIDASDPTTLANSNTTVFVFNTKADESYQYWRLFMINSYQSSYIEIGGLQFYGI